MAVYTTIDDAGIFFNPKIWTGTGSSNAITGVGFQPDFSWVKQRSGTENHFLQDAVRGSTAVIQSDTTAAEQTASNGMTSFDSDGFTVGTDTGWNGNTSTYVGWNWKANGAGSSNTDGSITSTVSANTTSGVSISTYTGTGSAATIGHGLGVAPKVVMCKQLNTTQKWINYNQSIGATEYLHLNETDAAATSSTVWNDTDPTSSVFSVGTAVNCNESAGTYVAYCFAEKQGFSKFGSYTGNGNADGAFVYTGFRPAWIMIKRDDGTNSWIIYDNKRQGYNINNDELFADLTSAEITTDDRLLLLSNGFKGLASSQDINGSGSSYIYMAFAESPLVNSNGVPTNAR